MDVRSLLIRLALILQAILQASVDASGIVCSNHCSVVHPQQHFCNADTAFKLKVVASDFVDINHEVSYYSDAAFIRYQGEVIAPLKGASWAEQGSSVFFYSPTGFTCSISTLAMDEIYLIAGKVPGGMLMITDCDGLAIKWSKLTPSQLAGVKGKYLEYCGHCQIDSAGTTKYAGSDASYKGEVSGYWSMTHNCFFNPIPSVRYGNKDCETLYGLCAALGGSGAGVTEGTCEWRQTQEYLDCFEEREDVWFLMENAEAAYTCHSQCAGLSPQSVKYKCRKAIKKLERMGHPRC